MVPFKSVPLKGSHEFNDVIKLAKTDLKQLNKQVFGPRFQNALIYEHVVYLGNDEGKNSLKNALEAFNQKNGKLQNVAINISGHGNAEFIGTSSIISLSPEQLAIEISNYIDPLISSDVRLSFYLRSCNSAYVESQTIEEAAMEAKKNTYSGKFCDSIKMLRENNSQPVSVSGYKGYLGVKKNKLCVTKIYDEENYQRSEAAENVRFVFFYDVSLNDIVVDVPKRYNFPVEGVFYQPINNYENDGILSQTDSEDEMSMTEVLAITCVLTIRLLCDKLANKNKIHSENSFVSKIQNERKSDKTDGLDIYDFV